MNFFFKIANYSKSNVTLMHTACTNTHTHPSAPLYSMLDISEGVLATGDEQGEIKVRDTLAQYHLSPLTGYHRHHPLSISTYWNNCK